MDITISGVGTVPVIAYASDLTQESGGIVLVRWHDEDVCWAITQQSPGVYAAYWGSYGSEARATFDRRVQVARERAEGRIRTLIDTRG